jgi:hypothetical protein
VASSAGVPQPGRVMAARAAAEVVMNVLLFMIGLLASDYVQG